MRDKFYYKDGALFNKTNRGKAKADEQAGSMSKFGYRRVGVNGTPYLEHRVIYAMHYGEIPDDMDVDHIDNNRGNNRIENLQLLSRLDNIMKCMREGNHNNPETPIIGVCVSTGRVIEFVSQMEAKRNGFHQGNINKCLLGDRATCKGYRWSYANKEIAA